VIRFLIRLPPDSLYVKSFHFVSRVFFSRYRLFFLSAIAVLSVPSFLIDVVSSIFLDRLCFFSILPLFGGLEPFLRLRLCAFALGSFFLDLIHPDFVLVPRTSLALAFFKSVLPVTVVILGHFVEVVETSNGSFFFFCPIFLQSTIPQAVPFSLPSFLPGIIHRSSMHC
jgi:hypothetical protein